MKTTKIKAKMKDHEYISQFFTEENKKNKSWKFYFLEDGALKPMNTSKMFIYAHMKELKTYEIALGYVPSYENYVDVFLKEVSSKEAAEIIYQENSAIALFSWNEKENIITPLSTSADFAFALSDERTFLMFDETK